MANPKAETMPRKKNLDQKLQSKNSDIHIGYGTGPSTMVHSLGKKVGEVAPLGSDEGAAFYSQGNNRPVYNAVGSALDWVGRVTGLDKKLEKKKK